MCLYTKQICPLRARKDIVCYKRFELVRPMNVFKLMRTAVRGTVVRIPTTDEPTIMTAYPENCIEKMRTKNTIDARFQIYGGMIHAITNIGSCRRRLWPAVVFKCIIPKGTLYYKGINGDICAKKMLVIKEVNPNTAG